MAVSVPFHRLTQCIGQRPEGQIGGIGIDNGFGGSTVLIFQGQRLTVQNQVGGLHLGRNFAGAVVERGIARLGRNRGIGGQADCTGGRIPRNVQMQRIGQRPEGEIGGILIHKRLRRIAVGVFGHDGAAVNDHAQLRVSNGNRGNGGLRQNRKAQAGSNCQHQQTNPGGTAPEFQGVHLLSKRMQQRGNPLIIFYNVIISQVLGKKCYM